MTQRRHWVIGMLYRNMTTKPHSTAAPANLNAPFACRGQPHQVRFLGEADINGPVGIGRKGRLLPQHFRYAGYRRRAVRISRIELGEFLKICQSFLQIILFLPSEAAVVVRRRITGTFLHRFREAPNRALVVFPPYFLEAATERGFLDRKSVV